MPDWMSNTRPPSVSRERWHALSTRKRRAAVRGYWRSLSRDTQHMLHLKGQAQP